MSASSYGIGKGEAQVFDTSGLAKQVVYNKEKREKFLLDSMMEMDSTNLWAARDMPGFQSMVDEYRGFVGQNYKSLSNPTKNMDVWLQKGDMESKIKLFVATSASDRNAANKYNNFLTLGTNNEKWEEIVDENGTSELDKFKQGIGQWATPGTSHSNTDFYQRKINLNTDLQDADKLAKTMISQAGFTVNEDGLYVSTKNEKLEPADWRNAYGSHYDAMTNDKDILDAYERNYKRAFDTGLTQATSAREWFMDKGEERMPALDKSLTEKEEKLPSISSILQTDERTFLNTTQIQSGKPELRLTNKITPEIAKNNWATKSDIEKRAFENMGDWTDEEGNTHTGINNADDWFKYWEVKQSQVNLEGTKGAAKSTPRYNYVSSNPKVYTIPETGYQTVNIENSKGRGIMTVPTIIDESGVEQIGESLDVLPISYQVQNGVIGVNVKTSSQDSSADYEIIDNEVKQLESNFNSAEKKLKEAGWEKGMPIGDIDFLAKTEAGYSAINDAQLEADIELVTNYEANTKTLIEKRNKLKSNYTGVGFIPLYNISDGSYTDNHALFGGRATGRAIEALKTGSSEVEEEEGRENTREI